MKTEPERRPIRSRDKALSRQAAAWLAGAGVSPNAISLAGMAAGIGAGVAFYLSPRFPMAGLLIGALLIQVRLLANMFDGMVAIATGRASPLGELFNEVPDRVSDTCIIVGAGYAVTGDPLPGFLGALAALMTAYIRAEGKVAGARQEFCGPMAKPQRMAVLTATAVLVALLPPTWQPNLPPPLAGGLMSIALWVLALGALWTAGRRLRRIAQTLRHPHES